MWVFTLLIFIAQTFAAEVSDLDSPGATQYIQSQSKATPLKPMTGTLSLENAVRNLGYRIEDLEVIQSEYTEGISAPDAAMAAGRHHKWGSRFGKSTLRVKRKRMVDQTVMEESIASRGPQKHPKPICTTSAAKDTRKLKLNTFGDIRRKQKRAKAATSAPVIQHRVFYLADQESRTAVAHLEPGESVTVVEVIGKTKKQPKRRVELRQKTHTMSITETQTEQVVCVNPNAL